MRIPTFAVAVCGGTLFRIGIGAIPFLLPMMLQLGFGDSAAQSGPITFASSAGALVMKPAAQRALRRLGFRDTLIWNGAALRACCSRLCAAFRPTWPVVCDLCRAAGRRLLPLAAIHRLQHAGLCRHPAPRMSAATSLYAPCSSSRHDRRHLDRAPPRWRSRWRSRGHA